MRELDTLDQEPFRSYRWAREEVLREKGDRRVQAWVKNRILEPRFDDPNAMMPKAGVSEAEAQHLAAYLLYQPGVARRARDFLESSLPGSPTRQLAVVFVIGFIAGTLFSLALWLVSRLLRRR